MMTSKILYPISLSGNSYDERVNSLIQQISNAPKNSIILAGELCLSGYELVVDEELIPKLKELLKDKILGFSRIVKSREIYNEFALVSSSGIIYRQGKHKLFFPNNEHKFFTSVADSIKIFELNGIKMAVLVCFELRFIEFWQRIKGVDIVLVPAMWGKEREEIFITLCKALAISNFCYVVASSCLDLEFKSVFSPDGKMSEYVEFDVEFASRVKRSLGILDYK